MKTSLIYSFNTKKTAQLAAKIKDAFGDNFTIEEVDAENLTEDIFGKYDRYILGVSTWFDGELPTYWDEFVPAIEDMNLKGKKFAIFGAGNQIDYPENFVDAIGIMAEILEAQGAEIVGFTSSEGYTFESSKALRNHQFTGLALDYENQASKNNSRISKWVEQLKKEF